MADVGSSNSVLPHVGQAARPATSSSEKQPPISTRPADPHHDALALSLANAHKALFSAVTELQATRGTGQMHAAREPHDASSAPAEWRALAANAVALVSNAQLEVAARTARAAHHESEQSHFVEVLEARMAELCASLQALAPAVANASSGEAARGSANPPIGGSEERRHMEQARHEQQIERLMMENEELRRASRAKTERISSLKALLAQHSISTARE